MNSQEIIIRTEFLIQYEYHQGLWAQYSSHRSDEKDRDDKFREVSKRKDLNYRRVDRVITDTVRINPEGDHTPIAPCCNRGCLDWNENPFNCCGLWDSHNLHRCNRYKPESKIDIDTP